MKISFLYDDVAMLIFLADFLRIYSQFKLYNFMIQTHTLAENSKNFQIDIFNNRKAN